MIPHPSRYLYRAGLVILAVVLLVSGCGFFDGWLPPSPTPPPEVTPTQIIPALPDLRVESMTIEVESGDPCADPGAALGIRVHIQNIGAGDAGPFVVEVNGAWQQVESGLVAGESTSLWFSSYSEESYARVDATFQIAEVDKSNNEVSRLLAVPILPPPCAPTPTPIVAVEEPLYTMEGHTGNVLTVAFSPDGNLVASGSVDNTMRLWRVNQGTLLRTMQGHPFPILTLAFAPNGATLATGSTDGLIRLWRVSDGRLESTLQGHAGWIICLAYSPDGRLLATCAQDYTVRLWRLSDGKLIQTVDEGMDLVSSLAFSADSRMLAWAETDGSVRVWSIADNSWLKVRRDSERAATSVAFSPDAGLLAAGFDDGAVRIWHTSGDLLHVLWGHSGTVSSMAFSPDGRLLVSGSEDGTLRMWQIYDSGLSANPIRVFTGHSEGVNSLAFSPNGNLIVSGSSDGTVRVWGVLP